MKMNLCISLDNWHVSLTGKEHCFIFQLKWKLVVLSENPHWSPVSFVIRVFAEFSTSQTKIIRNLKECNQKLQAKATNFLAAVFYTRETAPKETRWGNEMQCWMLGVNLLRLPKLTELCTNTVLIFANFLPVCR